MIHTMLVRVKEDRRRLIKANRFLYRNYVEDVPYDIILVGKSLVVYSDEKGQQIEIPLNEIAEQVAELI